MTADTANPYALVRFARFLKPPTTAIVPTATEKRKESAHVEVMYGDAPLTRIVDHREVDLSLYRFGGIDHLQPGGEEIGSS